MNRSDKQATLAIGEPMIPGGPPTVIVGMPDTAWLALKTGETCHFDLSHAGVRAQLVIFRAKDGAEVAEILGQTQEALTGAPDIGIKDPSVQ